MSIDAEVYFLCVFMSMCMCECMHVEGRGWHWLFSSVTPHLFIYILGKRLSLNLDLASLARQAVQESLDSCRVGVVPTAVFSDHSAAFLQSKAIRLKEGK